ncbi:MAG: GNAT family N-acetyltransferase [Solirubrobacteraceae bacterium]
MASSANETARVVRDVLLRDGSTLRLQAPTPDDFDDIRVFYEGLSTQSRYFRFHGFGRLDTIARATADAGGIERFALIGRHGGRVVAACNYEGLREPGVAEVAFAVADDDQQRGIGTRMLEQLAAVAAERGISRFDAAVLAENRPMMRVFQNAGFAIRREGFGEITVSLDITPTEAVMERIAERDHFATIESLRPVLAPASVAVVGATEEPGNVGRAIVANISGGGFAGVVVPVNPMGGVVCSRRAARGLAELEEAPDLVILAVDGEEVLAWAEHAAVVGARALLVVPGGPERDGAASQMREERLLEIVRDGGLRLIGPNALGLLNTDPRVRMNATFVGAHVEPGALAICSPSGAVGIGLLGHAAARGLGVSMFASLGNRADVSANDLLECWEQDGRTKVVILYMDTFGNPDHFTRLARRMSRRKPILAIKGRAVTGSAPAPAGSLTAAALRGDEIVDALLHQAGVLRFRGGDELFNAAEFFEHQPLPNGRRVGIVSNSAGVATLAVQACATCALQVREGGHEPNPLLVGMGGGPQDYMDGTTRLLADPAIDAVVAYYVDVYGGEPDAVLGAISAAASGQAKPVVACVMRSDGRRRPRSRAGVPNFLFPEACAAVLAHAAERREWLSRPLGEAPVYVDLDPKAAREIVSSFLERSASGGWLAPGEADALLSTHGIPVAGSYRCADVERAIEVAAELDYEVAVKADLAPPAQAGDINAVLRGLEDEEAVRAGWRELERRVRAAGQLWTGAIVQPLFLPGGADVLVGAVADPDLGPVLAVGLGGHHAGIGTTAAFRLLPITDADADELIDASESVAAELDGLRGSPPLDREALRELILRFALLLKAAPDVVEVDLNPIRCMQSGCVVLDTRLRIEHRAQIERVKTW